MKLEENRLRLLETFDGVILRYSCEVRLSEVIFLCFQGTILFDVIIGFITAVLDLNGLEDSDTDLSDDFIRRKQITV